MTSIYAPVMRVLVVAALLLATATLMFVAVNTARASGAHMKAPLTEHTGPRGG